MSKADAMQLQAQLSSQKYERNTFPVATFSQVMKYVRSVISGMKNAWPQVIGALILLSLGAWGSVMVPRLLGQIVDLVRESKPVSDLLNIGVMMTVIIIASAVVSAIGYYTLTKISERVVADLRYEMVSTTLDFPAHRVEEAGSGDVISRSTDDISTVSSAINQTLPVVTVSTFYILATLIALLTVDWQYIIVIALVIPVYVLSSRWYLKIAPPRYAQERALTANLSQELLEASQSRETVRAFRLENNKQEDITTASEDVTRTGMHARTPMITLMFWTNIAEILALIAVLGLGFVLVGAQATTVGAVTGAGLMVLRIRGPVMGIMRILDVVQSGYASLARVVGIINNPPQPNPDAGAQAPHGDVVMSNISFSYDTDSVEKQLESADNQALDVQWAVEDIDITIPAGHSLALVGTTGAGKTTVAALAAGLRLPNYGTVTFDGIPVGLLSDDERASRIALVSQDVHTFTGTLRDDVNLGKEDATDDEIMDALNQVGATWFQRLPRGLDTRVGAGGFPLEPVQAQQIALARILLRDPTLVVMDEATAEAGSEQAGALEKAAQQVMKGRTTIVVAHRLDQAALADEIVVMEHGRILEQGSHDELLKTGGRYAELWDAWKEGRE